MKNTWLRFAATAAVAGGMLLAAQEPGNQAPPAAVQQPHRPGGRIARYLNLTPDQQAQARAEFQAVRQTAQPIRAQLKQLRQEMFQAIEANDKAGIDRLSAQEATLKGQLSALRLEAAARVYQTLTPEQRARVDQMPALFRQMRQRRMQNQPNPNNG